MLTAFYTDERSHTHTLPGHPEHAGRLKAVLTRLDETGLRGQMQAVTAEAASEDALLRCHQADYLALLARTRDLEEAAMLGPDTYLVPESDTLARLAAGGTMAAATAILNGDATNGLVTARPPGHHATPRRGMGFCLLNNIAIAARHVQATHGLQRVAIVDFDVHHGNGTQDIFYDDGSVLFISSHQQPLYPGTGDFEEMGDGPGAGYTLNIPIMPGSGDATLTTFYRELVIPALDAFQPEMIFVSAGFDSHWRDPLAQTNLSLDGLATLTRLLYEAASGLCAGRILFVMEGGYDLEVLSHGVENVARCLLGQDEVSDPVGPASGERALDEAAVERMKVHHPLF